MTPEATINIAHRRGYEAGWREGMIAELDKLIPESAIKAAAVEAINAAPSIKRASKAVKRIIASRKQYLNGEIATLETELALNPSKLDALRFIEAWMGGPPTLTAVESSALHRALEAPFYVLMDDRPPVRACPAYSVFLIEHDWASVLTGADVDDGGFRLPFDNCCFECRIGGARACGLLYCADGVPYEMICLLETPHGWASFGAAAIVDGVLDVQATADGFYAAIFAQVRAIAITLDAEVVTATAIRAPHKLNVARIKGGKAPINDHHVLALNRRPRALAERLAGAAEHRKRLHFRRGHWRHYATFKTWIKWCLVGDPSLGFADKDYRL
jgi:hypothetical protein